jgi:hypothetical protein
MRTNGVTNFNILRSGGTENNEASRYAFFNNLNSLPNFGNNKDLYIAQMPNVTGNDCSSNIGFSYESPGILTIHFII